MRNLGLEATPPQLKPAESLVSEALADAWRAWSSLPRNGIAPARKSLAPTRFKAVLKNAFLVEVVDGGEDFRFVLGGDRIIRFLHERLAPGMLLSTIAGSLFHERATRAFRACVDARKPVAAGPSQTVLQDREYLALEVLLLPLSDDGANVTCLFGIVHTGPLPDDEEPAKPDAMPAAFEAGEARSCMQSRNR